MRWEEIYGSERRDGSRDKGGSEGPWTQPLHPLWSKLSPGEAASPMIQLAHARYFHRPVPWRLWLGWRRLPRQWLLPLLRVGPA